MLNGYRIEDLGLINYYYNMNTSGGDNGFYGNLIKYSADFNKVSEGSNLTYRTDMRIGLSSDNYLYGGGFGYMIAYYNGVAYSYTDEMAMIENKVLYIPNDTLDNSESYIAAAKKRIKDHIGRFTKLYYQIKEDSIDELFLKDIMKKDCVFPDIDYKIYS